MQRVNVELIDDMDKETPATETVRYGVNGSRYEIDLSADHLAEFRAALAPFIEHSRRSGGTSAAKPTSGRKPARTDRAQLAAMRQWGQDHGFAVSDKGRVPVSVQEAYHAAQSAPPKRSRARSKG